MKLTPRELELQVMRLAKHERLNAEPRPEEPQFAVDATTTVAKRPTKVTNATPPLQDATPAIHATPDRCTECEAKDAEIKELKRKLAAAIIDREPRTPMTSTERARKHREARRKGKDA